MGLWIFTFVMDMLIPLTMIGFGKLFLKNAPKAINTVFGYRTSMSMKNKDTWEFAHKYCGRLWYRCGTVLLLVSAVAMLFTIGRSESVTGTVAAVVCALQIVFLIGSIYPTEKALKQNFDRDGKRRCG